MFQLKQFCGVSLSRIIQNWPTITISRQISPQTTFVFRSNITRRTNTAEKRVLNAGHEKCISSSRSFSVFKKKNKIKISVNFRSSPERKKSRFILMTHQARFESPTKSEIRVCQVHLQLPAHHYVKALSMPFMLSHIIKTISSALRLLLLLYPVCCWKYFHCRTRSDVNLCCQHSALSVVAPDETEQEVLNDITEHSNLCFVLNKNALRREEKIVFGAFLFSVLRCEPPRDISTAMYRERKKLACWMRKQKIDESSFGFFAHIKCVLHREANVVSVRVYVKRKRSL